MQGPVQDEAGEPCSPAEISPSKEQRKLIFGFYIEKWRAFQDAKRNKEKAAEEEMRRVQVRRLCACDCAAVAFVIQQLRVMMKIGSVVTNGLMLLVRVFVYIS